MARIVLDPDEVNQAEEVTLTDGRVVRLAAADRAVLDRVARQLEVHRSSYAHAFVPDDPVVADRLEAGAAELEDVAPLYVRVAALRARSREGHRRPVDELDLRVLLQGRTWTSSSGVTRALEELTPTHRRNLLAWLERNSESLAERFREADLPSDEREVVEEAEPWVAGTPLHRRLTALIDEETGREKEMDRARQIVRTVEFERTGEWPEA